jgi:predicted amidophosphoribosyltransferase
MKAGELLRARLPASRGFTGEWLRNLRTALLSVVFPAGCRICEQLLAEATRIPICNDCLDSFQPITDAVCDKCGRPAAGTDTSDAEAFVCPTCVNDEWGGYAFERVRSWAIYEGALVRAILLLKNSKTSTRSGNCSQGGWRKWPQMADLLLKLTW